MAGTLKILLAWDNILLTIGIVGLLVCIASIVRTGYSTPSASPEPILPKKRIKLIDLVQNWKPLQKKQIDIRELCPLWRAEFEQISKDDDTVVHTFTHDRVRKFFYKFIHEQSYFKNARRQRTVIIQILHLLDNKGDCPSVVFVYGDPDSEKSGTNHSILKRVSLLNHSLNVAEIICQMIKNESTTGAMIMAPDALICALTHDLGKIPGSCADLYTSGLHPITSNTILQSINGFQQLKNRADIEAAIKMHHNPNLENEKNHLLRLLGAADKKARVVEEAVVIGLDQERFKNQKYAYLEKEEPVSAPSPSLVETTSQVNQDKNELAQDPQEIVINSATTEQPPLQATHTQTNTDQGEKEVFFDVPIAKQEPILPQETVPPEKLAMAIIKAQEAWKEQKTKYRIDKPPIALQEEQATATILLDGWFNEGQFLNDIENGVNRLYGLQIQAFSMPDGKIYVTRNMIQTLIKKQAKTAKIAWLSKLNTQIDLSKKKEPQFSQIWTTMMIGIIALFREKGLIDDSIKPGFYGNHFFINSTPTRTTGTCFYTVFLAKAFKTTIPEFESRKIAAALKNIKEVKPAGKYR